MAAMNLPTDCFNEIKGFLLFKKDERRRPLHFTAMNELHEYIMRRVTNGTIDMELWLPYGETRTCGESGYALDEAVGTAETGYGWESLNQANPYLAERLFVKIIKSLFNKTTRARMIMAYEDWREAAHDPDMDIEMAQAPVNIDNGTA